MYTASQKVWLAHMINISSIYYIQGVNLKTLPCPCQFLKHEDQPLRKILTCSRRHQVMKGEDIEWKLDKGHHIRVNQVKSSGLPPLPVMSNEGISPGSMMSAPPENNHQHGIISLRHAAMLEISKRPLQDSCNL